MASLHVLVVEDDDLQRDLVCAALRQFGVRDISAVGDARAALADLDGGHCDLLICDLNLPGMDGVEFLRQSAGRDVDTFAIMSAADATILATVENALVERGAHVSCTIPKPLTMEAVRTLLHRVGASRKPLPQTAPLEAAPPADDGMLETALRAREFVPFYQPKIALDSGTVLGVEVLARWRRPDGDIGQPASFIPRMEQTALIDVLTWQLIEQAFGDAACWDPALTIAINLAPRTMEDHTLPDRLAALARAYGIAAERITLELTETTVARSPQAVRDCVARLRLRGFSIAIDDFGIGYSTMELLLALPFTELKIDRGFVARLGTSPKARTVLEAMIILGTRLDLDVIAEGIESEDQLALLRSLGCPAAQGYHIARPMPHADLRRWLAQRRSH